MIRSRLWQPESWKDDELEMVKHFADKRDLSEQEVESGLEQSYRDT